MTTDDFLKMYVECERYAFYRMVAFLHGEEYVIKNQVWIEREFTRYFERMPADEKEKRIQMFIDSVNAIRKDGEQ